MVVRRGYLATLTLLRAWPRLLNMKRNFLSLAVLSCAFAALALSACAPSGTSDRAPEATLTITPLASPAAPDSGEPNLAVADDGTVYLSWLEFDPTIGHALKFASLAPGTSDWSAPGMVVARDDLMVNWADFPSLMPTRSGRLVAHWLQQSGDGPYTYDVMIAQSADAGASWSEPRVLHDDGVQAEHGFASFVETPAGDVLAIWLDGRNTKGASPEMALGFTTLGTDGAPGATALIDTRICDCCQTSAAWTSKGLAVVYRDRTAGEIRDISILRHVDGAWTQPARVHADEWMIEGCPVNGPAIAADGDQVAVAWFTGADGVEKVKVAFSSDAGATFGAPVEVDDGNPAGRVDVVLDPSGMAFVTWLERTDDDEAEVRLRSIGSDGRRSVATVVATTSAARESGFPRMVMAGDDLVFAWTEVGQPNVVRVARAQAAK
jgi:hypothetical protein